MLSNDRTRSNAATNGGLLRLIDLSESNIEHIHPVRVRRSTATRPPVSQFEPDLDAVRLLLRRRLAFLRALLVLRSTRGFYRKTCFIFKKLSIRFSWVFLLQQSYVRERCVRTARTALLLYRLITTASVDCLSSMKRCRTPKRWIKTEMTSDAKLYFQTCTTSILF